MKLQQLIRNELLAVFTNHALLLAVFGGVLLYSFLYPLPYSKQLPQEQTVVVVNLDGSQLSRRLIRMVNATPQVDIVGQSFSLAQAKEQMIQDKLAGILVIPAHFYRDLLQGKSPTLAYAGDASYFLVYGTVLEGMMMAGKTLAAEVSVTRLLMSGQAMELAEKQYTAITIGLHGLFNEAGGYVNYVIPAVFVLILHQTLIMGTGILGGTENEQLLRGEQHYSQNTSAFNLLLIRTALFFSIYVLLLLYYFGTAFKFYDIARLASIGNLVLISIPFLLSTTFLGIALGALFPRREIATLIVLLSSIPIIFSSGVIWPTSAIPSLILAAAKLVPAIPAIQAFVLLNQMGAELNQIVHLITHLILLSLLYGVMAYLLLKRKLHRYKQPASIYTFCKKNS
ncbi:MAG: ABC transporter permease [Desulfocapsa sp.]|nr:ABC transporter permease [Desulfocapsa sp.]